MSDQTADNTIQSNTDQVRVDSVDEVVAEDIMSQADFAKRFEGYDKIDYLEQVVDYYLDRYKGGDEQELTEKEFGNFLKAAGDKIKDFTEENKSTALSNKILDAIKGLDDGTVKAERMENRVEEIVKRVPYGLRTEEEARKEIEELKQVGDTYDIEDIKSGSQKIQQLEQRLDSNVNTWNNKYVERQRDLAIYKLSNSPNLNPAFKNAVVKLLSGEDVSDVPGDVLIQINIFISSIEADPKDSNRLALGAFLRINTLLKTSNNIPDGIRSKLSIVASEMKKQLPSQSNEKKSKIIRPVFSKNQTSRAA